MNEVIFFISVLLDLIFILFLYHIGGKKGLVLSVVINAILVTTFGAKLIHLFGFPTNSANGFYASIFLAVNILVEKFDDKEGYRAVWLGLSSLTFFIIISQFIIVFEGLSATANINEALATIFTSAPRIAFASMSAYIVAQYTNVFIYSKLKERFLKKYMWFRNIISSSVAELIDSVIFFSIAFFGVISFPVLIQAMLIGFGVKIIVALMTTPFLYLASVIKERELYKL